MDDLYAAAAKSKKIVDDHSKDNQQPAAVPKSESSHAHEPTRTSTHPDGHDKSSSKPPESSTTNPTKAEHQPTPRQDSNRKGDLPNVDDHLKLIKPGEKMHIPTNDHEHERKKSPPTSPKGVQKMAQINPLMAQGPAKPDKARSRSPSETAHEKKAGEKPHR